MASTRDTHPLSLVLLDSELQQVKICDFGEARRFSADQETLTGHCGTPYYQALEIWQRGKYTKAVDMWAAGVLLYVMVAKLQPWDYYFEEQFEEDEDFDPNNDQLRGTARGFYFFELCAWTRALDALFLGSPIDLF